MSENIWQRVALLAVALILPLITREFWLAVVVSVSAGVAYAWTLLPATAAEQLEVQEFGGSRFKPLIISMGLIVLLLLYAGAIYALLGLLQEVIRDYLRFALQVAVFEACAVTIFYAFMTNHILSHQRRH